MKNIIVIKFIVLFGGFCSIALTILSWFSSWHNYYTTPLTNVFNDVFAIIMGGLWIFFGYYLGKAKNWARIGLMITFLIMVVNGILMIFSGSNVGGILGIIISALGTIVNVIFLYFLNKNKIVECFQGKTASK